MTLKSNLPPEQRPSGGQRDKPGFGHRQRKPLNAWWRALRAAFPSGSGDVVAPHLRHRREALLQLRRPDDRARRRDGHGVHRQAPHRAASSPPDLLTRPRATRRAVANPRPTTAKRPAPAPSAAGISPHTPPPSPRRPGLPTDGPLSWATLSSKDPRSDEALLSRSPVAGDRMRHSGIEECVVLLEDRIVIHDDADRVAWRGAGERRTGLIPRRDDRDPSLQLALG